MRTKAVENVEPGDVIKSRRGDLKVLSFTQVLGEVTLECRRVRDLEPIQVSYDYWKRVTLAEGVKP